MPNNPALDKFIGFFEADVLNLYTSHPNRYELDTDYFEGELKTKEAYFYKLESSNRLNECINKIRFGYHKKIDGTLCIGVFLRDLKEAPEEEQKKWVPFLVDKSLLVQEDKRFKMWHDRYIKGSFNVESGPRKRLSYIIKKINACCKTLVELPLYTAVPDNSIIYPIPQNTYAYEDAHQRLYRFLVNSLSKKCLLELANLRNKTILEADNMKSSTLLRHVFCEFDKDSKLHTLLAEVSKQRSKPSHDRETAKESKAFEDFRSTLEIAVEAYGKLLELIETEFNVSSEHELRRHEIMEGLPKIDGDVHQLSAIRKATRMVGKTVEKVSFGMRKKIEDVQQTEVLYVHFTDGEILAINTVSNIAEILEETAMKPDELNVEFLLEWVPAPSNRSEDIENDA